MDRTKGLRCNKTFSWTWILICEITVHNSKYFLHYIYYSFYNFDIMRHYIFYQRNWSWISSPWKIVCMNQTRIKAVEKRWKSETEKKSILSKLALCTIIESLWLLIISPLSLNPAFKQESEMHDIFLKSSTVIANWIK